MSAEPVNPYQHYPAVAVEAAIEAWGLDDERTRRLLELWAEQIDADRRARG